MNIYDLDVKIVQQKPDKELGQTRFYDLTESTYQSRRDLEFQYYYILKEDEMRIDLICYKIYNNTDYIDILLNFNEIDNPLNIKEGDVLRYPNPKDIESLRYKTESKNTVKALLNRNKAPRKDDSRKKYIEDNFSLPPTVLPNPLEPITQDGNNIVIGGGLFNS